MVSFSVYYIRSKSQGRLILVFANRAIFEEDVKTKLERTELAIITGELKPIQFYSKVHAEKFLSSWPDKKDCFVESEVF